MFFLDLSWFVFLVVSLVVGCLDRLVSNVSNVTIGSAHLLMLVLSRLVMLSLTTS